jgi:type I restriction enzyme S subunit
MLRFGDALPRGWKWSRLCDVAKINPSAQTLPLNAPVSFIAMADVSEQGAINASATRRYRDVRTGFTAFTDNDVLVAKITPCFENGKGALARNLINGVGFGSTEFHVLRPGTLIDPEFLFIHTRTEPFRRYGAANMTGSAGQMRVPTSFVRDWTIPLPPLQMQRQIAEVLPVWDRAIAVAESTRDSIECLYLGIANQIVNRQGHNRRQLGDVLVPDRMKVVGADGPFRALGVRSHGKGTFQRIDDLTTLGSDKTLYRVDAGRFIVNIVFAWEGAAAITSDQDAGCLVSHRFPTFTIKEHLLLPEYFRHVIRTDYFRQLLALASPGGAGRNKTLNRSDLLRFEMYLPSQGEQLRAANVLSALARQHRLYERYSRYLIAQRDTLAVELLTGRLSVAEVDQLPTASI